jgi:hypothetical protein
LSAIVPILQLNALTFFSPNAGISSLHLRLYSLLRLTFNISATSIALINRWDSQDIFVKLLILEYGDALL